MNSGNQQYFQQINAVLMETLNRALGYLYAHDEAFKPYCLQVAAWDGVERLETLNLASETLAAPVKKCLSKCAEAKETMREPNIRFKEFSVAAESLTELAQQLDQISQSDPSLKEGIPERELASHSIFTNLIQNLQKLKTVCPAAI